jgi:trimeric autotransporter adhesin
LRVEVIDVKFRLHALLFSLLSLFTVLALLTGAMPSCAQPVDPTLDLTPTAQTLIAGQALQLTVTRRFSGGAIEDVTANVTYTSSNRAIATVSDRGVLAPTGSETGEVIVKVFDPGSNATALASFTVVEAQITSIDISPSVIVMTRSTPPRSFIATGRFNNGTTREITTEVLWTSTNTAAAIVGNSSIDRGIVSAVADGDTTILATDSKTGVAGRATVFVTGGSAVLQALVLTPNPAKVAVGMNVEMTAVGVYSDGSTKNLTKSVTWSSSRTDAAVIDSSGVVTGVAVGDTTVSASGPEPSTTVKGSAAVKVGP